MENQTPPAIGMTYKEIWEHYRRVFMAKGLTEHELKRIHDHWVQARAYAEGGPR